ncbi:MAG: hypothetical protein BWY63_00624 [Chloroflexi bacterium ADurb.Bin360]|nr:MAG: hypothetical protein BWY63_00624 [Chloroflexi bacterium ADurb.Bin360]
MTEQSEERKPLGWNYGGQALIEGVLMRGPHVAAVAVRHPDGTIDVKTQSLGKLYTGPLSKIPFVRGLPMLWDSLGLGMKALFYSAEVAGQEEDPNFSLQGAAGIGMGAFSLLLGVGLFMLLPSFIAGLLIADEKALLFNLVEGAIRLALLVGYMAAVGQMAEIRRVFAYHGAEHKTINAHEAGAPLTVEGIRPFTTAHPRCGTAFLLIVVLISILVFAPLGKPALLVRLASRLLLLPVISGIAYELLRFTGKHADNPLVRVLIAPNLALQRLTTREPDDSMLEVALVSLKAVLEGEAVTQG